jgi:uncharacterized spore protein YtfJ
MNDETKKATGVGAENWREAVAIVDKLFAVGRPESVFSAPVTAGDTTVITAAEVTVSVGAGAGGGYGFGQAPSPGGEGAPAGAANEGGGGGSGGAGGGVALGRPVAAIIISPQGVRVEPIVDPTKIALAFFTTLGSMAFMLARMRRAGRRAG